MMKASSWQFIGVVLRSKLFRILWRGYLAYLFVVIVLILPLLNWAGTRLYQQQTGRPLQYTLIVFNPFTLSLSINHPQDINPDGSQFWRARQLHVNFSLLQTLTNMTPTLDNLRVTGFDIHVHKRADATWNFSDIVEQQKNIAAREDDSAKDALKKDEVPALIVDAVVVSINSAAFTDSSRAEEFHTEISDISFQLNQFSTVKEIGQPYEFHAKDQRGGDIYWKGDLSVKAGSSTGELSVQNISLLPVWQYAKPYLNFDLAEALLSFQGVYQVHWKKELQWDLSKAEITIDKLAIQSRKNSGNNSQLRFSQFLMKDVAASSQKQSVAVGAIQLAGLSLSSWSNGSDIGLLQLFTINDLDQEQNNSSSATATPSGQNWVVSIQRVDVDSAIDWRVSELNNHLFKIQPLKLAVQNLHTSGELPANISLAATIDNDTQLHASGAINPVTFGGELYSEISSLPITLFNAVLTPYLNAEILSGKINAQAKVFLAEAKPTRISVSGNLAQFALRPSAVPEELVTWNDLSWQDLNVDFQQQAVDAPLVKLDEIDSQFIITTDGKTNIQSLFPEASKDQNSTAETVGMRESAGTGSSKPWQFTLHRFDLNNASFRFHDESLTPNFTAAIEHFTGDLVNLSSDTGELATFTFKGDVDGYAPVTLSGKTQPFLADPKLKANLNFENMDLGGFSTYSGTYAGWRIARGLLTANLHYALADGRIVGDNHIVLDQLQLGERVRSASAVDIPLRLALALLTDEKGVATLDVGISGDPDDPDFDISKVIWAAIRNTIMKIVTAPFNLLANLVKTDEDLGSVEFKAGSSELGSRAIKKLSLLRDALNKRPNLRLQLLGHFDQASDTQGLQEAQVTAQLREQGITPEDIASKAPEWAKAIGKLYQSLEINKDETVSGVDQQYEKLLQSAPVTDLELKQLAQARTVLVKQYLIQNLDVANSRVLINSELDCSKPDNCNRRAVSFDLSDLTQASVQP